LFELNRQGAGSEKPTAGPRLLSKQGSLPPPDRRARPWSRRSGGQPGAHHKNAQRRTI